MYAEFEYVAPTVWYVRVFEEGFSYGQPYIHFLGARSLMADNSCVELSGLIYPISISAWKAIKAACAWEGIDYIVLTRHKDGYKHMKLHKV